MLADARNAPQLKRVFDARGGVPHIAAVMSMVLFASAALSEDTRGTASPSPTCGWSQLTPGRLPASLGDVALLSGVRRVFVQTGDESSAWLNIVNVLRRDVPELKVVPELADAEVVLRFEHLAPLRNEGTPYEAIAGWGRGFVCRRDAAGEYRIIRLVSPGSGVEVPLGVSFAERFVADYKVANASK